MRVQPLKQLRVREPRAAHPVRNRRPRHHIGRAAHPQDRGRRAAQARQDRAHLHLELCLALLHTLQAGINVIRAPQRFMSNWRVGCR